MKENPFIIIKPESHRLAEAYLLILSSLGYKVNKDYFTHIKSGHLCLGYFIYINWRGCKEIFLFEDTHTDRRKFDIYIEEHKHVLQTLSELAPYKKEEPKTLSVRGYEIRGFDLILRNIIISFGPKVATFIEQEDDIKFQVKISVLNRLADTCKAENVGGANLGGCYFSGASINIISQYIIDNKLHK